MLVILVIGFALGAKAKLPTKSASDEEMIKSLGAKIFDFKRPMNLLQSPGVSLDCQRDFTHYLSSLLRMELWALQMFDASATLPSGILSGNINSFGDFQECLRITNVGATKFKGKHCYVELQPFVNNSAPYINHLRLLIQSYEMVQSRLEDPAHIFNRFSSIIYGVCVPSTCTHHDVEAYAKHLIIDFIGNNTGLRIDVQVANTMCHVATAEKPHAKMLSNGAKITIVLLSSVVIFSLFSTYFDEDTTTSKDKNQWMAAFSMTRNYRKLISTRRNDDDIKAIHGVKFINALLIFICHKTVDSLIPSINRTHVALESTKSSSIIVRICALYTDMFLMLSGVLVAYSITSQLMTKRKINVAREYIMRYVRIMPNVMCTMLLTAHILPLVAQSTAQKTLIIDKPAELCVSNGWRNLLLIQNWFRFEEMCNLHSHHIGTDFELFLIAPFLLILLWKQPKKGYAVMISLGLLATVLRFYETYTKSLTYFVPFSAKLSTLIQTANYLYTLPTHRFTVYGIGLTLGFFLRQNRGVKVNNISLFVGQSVSGIAIALIVGACEKMNGLNVPYDKLMHATFAAFAPILACVPVAWIIFLSYSGHNNFIVRFLEWDGFVVSTKLCYSFYLIQIPIFQLLLANRRDIRYYNPNSIFDLNEIFVVFVSAVAMTIFIEMPILNLKKNFLGSDNNKTAKEAISMNGNGVNGCKHDIVKK